MWARLLLKQVMEGEKQSYTYFNNFPPKLWHHIWYSTLNVITFSTSHSTT